MRVYEIAREVGLPNKELISKLRALGLEVNNHMSSLDPESVARVKRSLERERVENTVTKRLSSTVLRRRSKAGEEGAPPAPPREGNGSRVPQVATTAPRAVEPPPPIERAAPVARRNARPAPEVIARRSVVTDEAAARPSPAPGEAAQA